MDATGERALILNPIHRSNVSKNMGSSDYTVIFGT